MILKVKCGCVYWDDDEENYYDNTQIQWCPVHRDGEIAKRSTDVLIKNWTPNLCCSCGHVTYPPAALPDLEDLIP